MRSHKIFLKTRKKSPDEKIEALHRLVGALRRGGFRGLALSVFGPVGIAAALVLSRLSDTPLQDFLLSGPAMPPEDLNHLVNVLSGAQGRHKDAADPVEVLACFGGFEMAMMVGVMLVAGSKRNLVIADGMTACAALMVASRIAPAVTDYCVYCRSHNHNGLDRALSLFQATALLELGMESTDGTGATLAWPLVRSAAALLTEVAEGEDPGPSLPADIAPNSRAGSLG